MSIYDDFDERTITVHKLGSAYGWTPKQIFDEMDYHLVKSLLKLLATLEKDQTTFMNPQEAAFYKNLKRLFPPENENKD